MKLELKQLAPYLPYGLKWTSSFGGTDRMTGIITDNVIIDSDGTEINESIDLNYTKEPRCKPILRPLSDLDKHSPELISDFNLIGLPKKELDCINGCSYEFVIELLKSHYDIFGLIEKGLAVDVNTHPQ